MPAPVPPFIPQPFANDAADPTYRVDIPDADPADGHASYELGFPPITMTPVISGGTPPYGQDVNGILYILSSHLYALQAGQLPEFDPDVAAAIGGYKMGAILSTAGNTGIWFNVTDNNTTNPVTAGSGWVALFRYGPALIPGLTGGTRTLTPTEAAARVVRIAGTLTSNLQLVFPDEEGEWRIVNSCTGAFTVTAKTASGTGVVIPAGGFSASTIIFTELVSGVYNAYPG